MDGAQTQSEPKLAQIIQMLENNVSEARSLALEFDKKSRALLDNQTVSEATQKEEHQPGGALPILQKLVYQLGEINSINRETLASLNELI